ncbi:MAG: hypothetical protein K8T10_00790 [Candidatus Eremiobacteraeota bacterium]|nr:hypothetical protein [Candidatus Eremiobacteraeota bacterium]
MTENKFLQVIEKPFSLTVSIPKNDPDMAVAAAENGADAIKVHINVGHYASGTKFGTWEEEKGNIAKIIDHVSIPVGLLPGQDQIATRQEVEEARDMGIEFLDAFAHSMPLYLWKMESLGYMLAANLEYDSKMLKALEFAGMNALEATILPHEEYGKRLNMRDIALYRKLVLSTSCPVIVPTQKDIRPEELRMLKRMGIRGIVIGAVVTGRTVEGVAKVTGRFRKAIDDIEKRQDIIW